MCYQQWYDNGLFFFAKRREIGNPLSSYLFVLAVKTLAIPARQNKDIIGIFENETKLFQYANDTTINDFVRLSKDDVAGSETPFEI